MAHLAAACLTHRRTPLALLARLPRGDGTSAVVRSLADTFGVRGAVVLSTCNRFEVYVDAERLIDADEIAAAIARLSGLTVAQVAGHLELYRHDDAVRHLFTVAAGIDSRVVGEEEILGQVRAAADTARAAGALGGDLTALFQWAVRAGRRARRGSGFGRGRSTAHHAVEALDAALTGVGGRLVVVVGAGQIAKRTVRILAARGADTVVCARRPDVARAAVAPARVEAMAALPRLLRMADAVVCATSADRPVVTADAVAGAVAHRHARALPIVDLSMPRNVEPAAAALPGVTVVDLDTMGAENPDGLVDLHVAAARRTVDAEADGYAEWRRGQEIGPLIRAMTDAVEQIRQAELRRVADRLGDEARAVADEMSRRLVGKLLHEAVTSLRANPPRLAG